MWSADVLSDATYGHGGRGLYYLSPGSHARQTIFRSSSKRLLWWRCRPHHNNDSHAVRLLWSREAGAVLLTSLVNLFRENFRARWVYRSISLKICYKCEIDEFINVSSLRSAGQNEGSLYLWRENDRERRCLGCLLSWICLLSWTRRERIHPPLSVWHCSVICKFPSPNVFSECEGGHGFGMNDVTTNTQQRKEDRLIDSLL